MDTTGVAFYRLEFWTPAKRLWTCFQKCVPNLCVIAPFQKTPFREGKGIARIAAHKQAKGMRGWGEQHLAKWGMPKHRLGSLRNQQQRGPAAI